MKLSHYVTRFIEEKSNSIFLLSGGGIMHLVDSVGRSKLKTVCCHHEQAAAIAAEGYGRITKKPGFVLVTTGPGGTNAITGVAGSWLDSIPMFVISGQVKTDNIAPKVHNEPSVRAVGFQELNIIDLVRPITKYAATVDDPRFIRYHLEKAYHIAITDRPGPVWIEIPLDIQEMDIDPETLPSFTPRPQSEFLNYHIPMSEITMMLKNAKRPLMLVGSGVWLGNAEKDLLKVLNKFKFNVATVMFTADDVVTYDYPYYLGRQGINGNQSANYAIDNCDTLLIIGSRLQLTQTSYDYRKFAPLAKKIMVDIDPPEFFKKTIHIDLPVFSDAKYFLEKLAAQKFLLKRWDITISKIDPDKHNGKKEYVNVYSFVETLSKHSKNYTVATADGMASVVPHQGLIIHPSQRFLTNAGLGHMGSGLPLAIGACVANASRTTICMEGDGSIMLNIQELQTILHHKMPIKLFIWNNSGYYSIRNTHKNYFNRIFASDLESGVSFPNFEKIITAWGFTYEKIQTNKHLFKIKHIIESPGPVVCELMIDPFQPLIQKWSAGELTENN